jgi:hypothetical protein
MDIYLEVIGIASQKAIDAINESGTKFDISELIGIFCSYSEFDIPLGYTFSYLVTKEEKKIFPIFCEVKIVTQAWGLIFEKIPLGHKTLCFVKLDIETERLFRKNLPIVDDWSYHSKHQYLSDLPNFLP